MQLRTLREELMTSQTRGEALESRTGSHIRRLVSEVDAMRERHRTELQEVVAKLLATTDETEKLRERVDHLQRSNDALTSDVERSERVKDNSLARVKQAEMKVAELQGKIALKVNPSCCLDVLTTILARIPPEYTCTCM